MSNDELYKGLAIFQNGVKQLATNMAIKDATQQIQQINTQITDETEKQAAMNQLSQGLALQLAGAGASAADIEQTAGRIGLSAPQQANIQTQFDLQANAQNFNAEQGALDRASRERQAALMGERRNQQLSRAERKDKYQAMSGYQKQYNQYSKDLMRTADQAGVALSILKQGNPVGDQAIGTFLARLSGEVGNLTEAERDMFRGSPALIRKAKALYHKYKNGTIAPEDRADIIRLANTMSDNVNKSLEKRRTQIAGQAVRGLGALGFETSMNEAREFLDTTMGGDEEDAAAPQQQEQQGATGSWGAGQGAAATATPPINKYLSPIGN